MFKRYGTISIIFVLILLLFFQLVQAKEKLTLMDVLEKGLENNSQIKNSLIDRKKAQTELDLARRYLYPEINVQSTYTRMGEPPSTPIKYEISPAPDSSVTEYYLRPTEYQEVSVDSYNTSISLRQPIYTGGQAKTGIQLAEKGLELSDIQYKKQVSDTLYQIIQAYYNILRAENMVKIQENFLDVVEEHKRIVSVNIEAGMSIKSDLLSVEIEKRRISQSIEEVKNNLILAKKRLAGMIKKDLEKINLENPGLLPEINLNSKELYQQALINRPEFKTLDINSEMTAINKKLKENIYRPSVFLNGNYSWQSDEFSFDDGSWNINLTASMPLYDGGKSKKEEEKISLELNKLEENKESLIDNIKLEIDSITLAIEQTKNSMKLEKLSIENARENLKIASKRYKSGVGTNMDVIDAQNNLKQCQIKMTEAEYDYALKLFELLYKTGRLRTYCGEVSEIDK